MSLLRQEPRVGGLIWERGSKIGLEEEGISIRTAGNKADSKGNKEVGDTISKVIGINKVGIEGIVGQLKDWGTRHLKV